MGPDFLGIGAQKSGTTWLYQALSAHPQIMLPPLKELHYFDVQRTETRASYPIDGVDPEESCRRIRRMHALSRLRHGGGDMCRGRYSLETLRWDMRYLFGRRSDRWYVSLFEKGEGQLTGEITPAYAILQREHIAAVHALLPDVRLIYMIRNPVDRAWSSAFSNIPAGKSVADVAIGEWKQLFDRPQSRARDDFIGTIDRWLEFYPPDRLFVGTLDEVKSDPVSLLKRLYDFLGVSYDEGSVPGAQSDVVKTGKRSGTDARMPEEARRYLYEMHYGQICELARRYGNPAQEWLAEADAVLSRGRAYK